MKKIFMLSIIALAVSCGSCWGAGTAQAEETALSSRGTIVYRQDGAEVALYAEDLFLLEKQLSTMPGYTFDPGGYDHSAWQETAREQSVETVGERNRAVRAVMEESDFYQGDEAIGEEQTETEKEDGEEMLEQPETENVSVPEDPSEENMPEGGDEENPSEENPAGSGSQEDPSASADLPKDTPSESGDQENPPASADLPEENPPESKEDTSAPTDPSEGKLSEGEEKEDMPGLADPTAEKTESEPDIGSIQDLSGQPEESRPES